MRNTGWDVRARHVGRHGGGAALGMMGCSIIAVSFASRVIWSEKKVKL